MGKVTWELKNGIIRAYKDGKEMQLLPGTTWDTNSAGGFRDQGGIN